jgi:DNA sulfur modification protein DndE
MGISAQRELATVLGPKFALDEASTQLLRTLKARTGLTHQYLCRLGFCISVSDPSPLDPALYSAGGLEFNRYTLTGEWDRLFVAYLREWLQTEPRAEEFDEMSWFQAHINRGLAQASRRVRSLVDIPDLVSQ